MKYSNIIRGVFLLYCVENITGQITVVPSEQPSAMPSEQPIDMPSGMPIGMPSEMPSENVCNFPTPSPLADSVIDCEVGTQPIGKFEVRKIGTILNVPATRLCYGDGLSGEVFYEIDGKEEDNLFVELYSDPNPYIVEECDVTGTLLDQNDSRFRVSTVQFDGTYNSVFPPQNNDECFPQTADGVIGTVKFLFPGPFYQTPTDMKIWTPNDGSNDDNSYDGTINLCVRVGYKLDDDITLVSFLDTKVSANLDLTASFDSSITVASDQTEAFEQNVTTVIDIETFLCGYPGKNEGRPYTNVYGAGQSLRVCVDFAKVEDRDMYNIVSIKDVTCTNDVNSYSRTIIDSDGTSIDPMITDIYDPGTDVTGSMDIGGNKEASEKAVAFATTVTSGYFGQNPTENDSIYCQGEIEVEFGDTTSATASRRHHRRRMRVLKPMEMTTPNQNEGLLRLGSNNNSNGNGSSGNTIREPFAASIQLSSSIESSSAGAGTTVFGCILLSVVFPFLAALSTLW